jgi:hypothetical protein
MIVRKASTYGSALTGLSIDKGQEDVAYTLTYRAVGTEDEVPMHGTFSRNEASKNFDASAGAALHNFRLAQADPKLIIR